MIHILLRPLWKDSFASGLAGVILSCKVKTG